MRTGTTEALLWYDEWSPKIQVAWGKYVDRKRNINSTRRQITESFNMYAEIVRKAAEAAGGE